MKKVYILAVVLLSALVFAFWPSSALEQQTIIVNHKYFQTLTQRQQLYSCMVGGNGKFVEALQLTLYTQSNTVDDYRAIKARLESWGAKVVLRKADEVQLFDMRAGGGLPIYLWEGTDETLFEAFQGKNAEFYSTGWKDGQYDRLYIAKDKAAMKALLIDNICIIEQ